MTTVNNFEDEEQELHEHVPPGPTPPETPVTSPGKTNNHFLNGSFKIHKNTKDLKGAVMELAKGSPYNKEKNDGSRDKVVFLEISPQVADKKYDYNKKIKFKLSNDDIGKILWAIKNLKGIEIIHDSSKANNDTNKSLSKLVFKYLTPTENQVVGKFMITLSKADQTNTIYITEPECINLEILLQNCILHLNNWN